MAVVAEDAVETDYDGVTGQFYFKTASEGLAEEYGEALSLMMSYYSETFGSPYTTNLTVVETGEFAPVGYSAPGIIFLSSSGIGEEVNRSLLGKEVSHQWWRVLVSPGNRNHSWMDIGLARYSAMLEVEENEGETQFNAMVQDLHVDALTYDEIPLTQEGRLPDF